MKTNPYNAETFVIKCENFPLLQGALEKLQSMGFIQGGADVDEEMRWIVVEDLDIFPYAKIIEDIPRPVYDFWDSSQWISHAKAILQREKWPQSGQTYYYIKEEMGRIVIRQDTYENRPVITLVQSRAQIGNCFRTMKEAEKAQQNILAVLKGDL